MYFSIRGRINSIKRVIITILMVLVIAFLLCELMGNVNDEQSIIEDARPELNRYNTFECKEG